MRILYIVPKGSRIDEKIIQRAKELGCSEVVNGIPPNLAYKYNPRDLPVVHEEHNWFDGLGFNRVLIEREQARLG